jgi:hypothetical protein
LLSFGRAILLLRPTDVLLVGGPRLSAFGQAHTIVS